MQQWIGVPMPDGNNWPDDDAAWATVHDQSLEVLLTRFQTIRQQQIDLLDALAAVNWQEPRATLWGQKPLAMVVTKTFQHTYEHGDTLLRMGLWWKDFAEHEM
jgi:hypothetical protein